MLQAGHSPQSKGMRRGYRGAMPVGGGWALRSRGQPQRFAGGEPTAGGLTRTPQRSETAISPTSIKACQHQPLVVRPPLRVSAQFAPLADSTGSKRATRTCRLLTLSLQELAIIRTASSRASGTWPQPDSREPPRTHPPSGQLCCEPPQNTHLRWTHFGAGSDTQGHAIAAGGTDDIAVW